MIMRNDGTEFPDQIDRHREREDVQLTTEIYILCSILLTLVWKQATLGNNFQKTENTIHRIWC